MGLVISAIGTVLVALSLFALKWVDADKGTFLDLSKSARDASGDAFSKVYGEPTCPADQPSPGLVLVALTALLVLAAGLPLPHSAAGNAYPRFVGSVVAGGAAVLQAITMVPRWRVQADPESRAWLGRRGLPRHRRRHGDRGPAGPGWRRRAPSAGLAGDLAAAVRRPGAWATVPRATSAIASLRACPAVSRTATSGGPGPRHDTSSAAEGAPATTRVISPRTSPAAQLGELAQPARRTSS